MWKTFSRSVWEVVERRVGLTVFRSDSSSTHGHGHGERCEPPNRGRISCLVPRLNLCGRVRNIQGSQEQTGYEDREGPKQQKDQSDGKWNEPHFNHQLLGAFGWSSAVVLGWYISQPLGLHRLFGEPHRRRRVPQQKTSLSAVSDVLFSDAFAQSPVQPLKILPVKADPGISSAAVPSANIRSTSTSSVSSNDDVGSTSTIGSTSTEFDDDFFSSQHGPFTPEEALNEATRVFEAANRTLAGDVENKLGTRCMEKGQPREALKHFRRAARLENATAAYNLGQCYELGLGTQRNLRKAVKWYTLASDHGHATGMYNLAVFFAHGWGGLTQDKGRAHELLVGASKLGLKKAEDALSSILSHDSSLSSTNRIEEVDENPTNAFLEMLGVPERKTDLPQNHVQAASEENMSKLDWLDLSSSSASEEMFPNNSHGQYYDGLALERGWSMVPTSSPTPQNYSLCENTDPAYSFGRSQGWMADPSISLTLYQLAANHQHSHALFRLQNASKPSVIDLVHCKYSSKCTSCC